MRQLTPCSLLEADSHWHVRFDEFVPWALGIPSPTRELVESECEELELACADFTTYYRHFGHQLEVTAASGGFVSLSELCFVEELFDIDSEELGIDEDAYYVVFFRVPNGDLVVTVHGDRRRQSC